MYAPRRYGKTSLVKKVLARFSEEGVSCIYFDRIPRAALAWHVINGAYCAFASHRRRNCRVRRIRLSYRRSLLCSGDSAAACCGRRAPRSLGGSGELVGMVARGGFEPPQAASKAAVLTITQPGSEKTARIIPHLTPCVHTSFLVYYTSFKRFQHLDFGDEAK